MVEKKEQTLLYSDNELKLIKQTFGNNPDLVLAMRKNFLQMPLDPIDLQALKDYKGKEVLKIVRKHFLPELDPKAPRLAVIDMWMSVPMKERTPEQVFPDLIARQLVIDYLNQQLEVLEGTSDHQKISFSKMSDLEGKTAVEAYCEMSARNTIIAHTEMQMQHLLNLAKLADETPEQTEKRLKLDSSK